MGNKMSMRPNTLTKMHEEIQKESWNNKARYYSDEFQEAQVQILPDASVSIAKFIPSKINPSTYHAHPDTIKALRKDLFVAGADFSQFEFKHCCLGCNSELDLQFWRYCPYCGAKFPKDLRWKD